MKKGKRLLSLLLTVVMVLGLFPTSAFAANEPSDYAQKSYVGSLKLSKDLTYAYSAGSTQAEIYLNPASGEQTLNIELGANVATNYMLCLNENKEANIAITVDGKNYTLTKKAPVNKSSNANLLSITSASSVTVKDITLKAEGSFTSSDFNNVMAALLYFPSLAGNITLDNVTLVDSYNAGIHWMDGAGTMTVLNSLTFFNSENTGYDKSRYYDLMMYCNDYTNQAAVPFTINKDSSGKSPVLTGHGMDGKVIVGIRFYGSGNASQASFTTPYELATGTAITPEWANKFVCDGYSIVYMNGSIWIVPASYNESNKFSVTGTPGNYNVTNSGNTDLTYGSAISEITLSPASGYKFKDTTPDLTTLNNNLASYGLTATWDSTNKCIKINGYIGNDVDLSSIGGFPAMENDSVSVNLGTLPTGLKLSNGSGSLSQTPKQWSEFQNIVLEADSGYTLPGDISALNNALSNTCLKAEVNDGKITISPKDNATLSEVNVNLSNVLGNFAVKNKSVNLGTLPTGLTLASGSGALKQDNLTGPMTDVVLKVENGYILPNDYVNQLNGNLSGTGLTAAVQNDGSIKISGTPTKDVDLSSITWPALSQVEAKVGNTQYANLKDAMDTTSGTIEMVKAPSNAVSDATLKNGVTLKDTNGNTYKAGEDSKIDVATSGQVTLKEGKLDVTPAAGATNGASVQVAKDNQGGAYTVSGSNAFTVSAGKNDAPSVTIPEAGKTVSNGAGLTFTAGKENSTFPLDGSKLNNEGDAVTVGSNGSAEIEVGTKDGTPVKVTVPADSQTKNTGDVTVTRGDGTDEMAVVTVSKSGDTFTVGGKTFKAGADDTKFAIKADGTVELVSGKAALADGESFTGTQSGKTILNPASSGNDSVTVESDKTNKCDVVTVPKGGSGTVTIGQGADAKTFANMSSTEDLVLKVGQDGTVSVKSGTLSLADGQSVVGGVSGATILNPTSSGDDQVSVKSESDKDVVTVPAGKSNKVSVTKGDKTIEYTNASDSEDLVLEIDANGTASLNSGAVDLDKDESVGVNGANIKNTDEEVLTVTKNNDGTGTIDIAEGGSFAVGDTVIDSNKGRAFPVDQNGNIKIGLTDGNDSITIGGVSYTGGPATITVDKNGNISGIEGTYTVEIPEATLNDSNFSYPLRKGERVTVGGYTYTAPNDTGYETGDITIKGNGQNQNPTVILKNSDSKVNVSLKADPSVNTDYTAASADTRFAMSKSDTDTTKIDLQDNGKTPNSSMHFADDKTHTVNGIAYKGAAESNPGYTVSYGKNGDANSNTVTVEQGSKVTAKLNRNDSLKVGGESKINGTTFGDSLPITSTTDNTEIIIDNTSGTPGISGSNDTNVKLTKNSETGAVTGAEISKDDPNAKVIEVNQPKNGTLTAEPTSADTGKTVTITVKPDKGYQLDKLIVTDSKGNILTLTKISDTQYSFVKPDGKVNVSATFVEAGTDHSTCPKDDTCPISAFTDAQADAWYHDGVHYCLANNLMLGYGNGKFGPDNATTRAQIIVMLWRLNGSPAVNYTLNFKDVAEDAWYTEAIRWAASEEIVLGYGDGSFGPDNSVTREQMAAILYRYTKYKGIDVTEYADTSIDSFADHETVSDFAVAAMKWAHGAGVIIGMENDGALCLAPKGATTRAQIAKILMCFCTQVMK